MIDKAVANFFTPASKKEPDRLVWRTVNDSLLIGTYKSRSEEPLRKGGKIAAFDLVRHVLVIDHRSIRWLNGVLGFHSN